MKRRVSLFTHFLTFFLLFGLVGSLSADHRDRIYEVTVTNITKNQVFSPPILVTHRSSIRLFQLGAQASESLAKVAEGGDTSDLAVFLENRPEAFEVLATMDPIPAGKSRTYRIRSRRGFSQLSVAGMLVNTNDAFFALNSTRLPRYPRSSSSRTVVGYDAGSETNNEDCAFIPGPACPDGSGNLRDTADAEGFVHVNNGIHGIADLEPEDADWRNPVAAIRIKRLR